MSQSKLQALSAAASAITRKLEAAALDPGTYAVDSQVVVEVHATIVKAAPSVYRPTNHLPLKAILAVALRQAGVARADIAKQIAKAARKALTSGGSIAEELKATEEALELVEATIEKLPEKTREGSTKVDGTVEIVGFKALAAQAA